MADRSVRIEPSDRAQLMLVGAVAIALVIVGIVVVYNTVLFSDTQTATGTTNDARQAEAFSQQVQEELRTLGGELERDNNLSEGTLTQAVREWSAVQSQVHANTDPAFVKIDPGDCSGVCTSGSQFNATLVWESQDFESSDSVDVRLPFPDVGPTVYAVNPLGEIIAVEGDGGSVTTYDRTANVLALGPANASVDGDPAIEVPYVAGTGTGTGPLQLTEDPGPGDTLVASGVKSDESRLAVGQWDGGPTSVFYVSNDAIERANVNGSFQVVDLDPSGNPDGVNAVVGIDDVNNDSDPELVFVSGSNTVKYVESPGSCGDAAGSECTAMANGDVNNGPGIGAGGIADFDGDGSATVVATTSPGNLKLIGAGSPNGEPTEVVSSISDMAAAPPGIADVDDDGLPEIVYVSTSGILRYVDDPRTDPVARDLLDANGNTISASADAGVVGS